MTSTKFDLDPDFVRRMAKLLRETGLTEIEYAEGERRIRLSSGMAAAPVAVAAAPATEPAKPVEKKEEGTPVPSPMVGTVYLAAQPGAEPFVKVGSTVKAGDTLLIIEAMKVMNPIKAPVGGVIKKVVAADTKPVEFGETLVIIG